MKIRLHPRFTLLPLIFLPATSPLLGQSTFLNPAPITINDGTATPYPSNIVVSGLGSVTKVTLTLSLLSHNFPDDIDMLLVGPQGHTATIFSDVGGAIPASNVTITLDDAAAFGALPDNGPLVSGTFQPTNIGTTDTFPAPAPAGFSTASPLSVFNGTDPNGTWSLYVVDDLSGDIGSISGGWSITITAAAIPEPSTWMLVSLGSVGMVALAYRRRRNRVV